jgi:hypothetical protein
MKDQREWGQVNAEYLGAAVEWVRQKFLAALEDPKPAKPPKFPKPAGAMAVLSERLRLSSFDQQILALLVAAEMDPRIPELCGRLQGGGDRPFPTFAVALSLLDESAWESLTPGGPLRFWRLIEVEPHARSVTGASIRIDERILHFLKGIHQITGILSPSLRPVPSPAAEDVAPSQLSLVQSILDRWRAEPDYLVPVQLTGPDSPAKELVAFHAAAALGQTLYRINADQIPSAPLETETFGKLWQRDAMLSPVALFIDADDQDLTAGAPVGAVIDRFLTGLNTTIFVACREPLKRSAGRGFALEIHKPDRSDQRDKWLTTLQGDTETAELLAGQFNLNFSDIGHIESYARAVSKDKAGFHDRLWRECVRTLDPRLSDLASEVRSHSTWDDIILPPAEFALLRAIVSRVKYRTRVHIDWGYSNKLNRGLGICALFAGDSGVGKTRAAEIVANELHLSLFRIDLSAVMSKYIGEAEKQLRKIFDAAEDGGAILFFDEADALFGKRSEIISSHDRFANVEIDYLLQRIEVFRGLVILATNMKHALDTAFTRRMQFIVNFPFPGPAERRRLWMQAFPRETPVGDLDIERLARFAVTGGTIQNIALQAAFQAAEAGSKVDTKAVLSAARMEFLKMNRFFIESEFQITGQSGAAA